MEAHSRMLRLRVFFTGAATVFLAICPWVPWLREHFNMFFDLALAVVLGMSMVSERLASRLVGILGEALFRASTWEWQGKRESTRQPEKSQTSADLQRSVN